MSQLALQVVGHASKRGLIPRQPPADGVLAGIETWLRAEYPDAVRGTVTRTIPDGAHELRVALHPAATDVAIRALDTGSVEVSAPLHPVGPGYQTFVARLVQRIGTEHDIAWTPPPDPDADLDPADAAPQSAVASTTDLIAAIDRSSAEQAYLAWLGTRLLTAREIRRRGASGIHLGTPPGVLYTFDGAVATSLGPRDDAWLERAVADSRVAIEVTPWWADATDARCLLNRALCLMWTDIRWRPPTDDAERAIHEEVLRLLARAFPLDPSLPYPWHEWKELADWRGVEDAMTRQVDARALQAEPGPPIGYRREPVRIEHEGWAIEVPGSFAERRTDEEWWGGDGGRSITLAATETGTADGPMTAHDFLQQVAADLGPEALTHQSGRVSGRARLTTDPTSGIEIGVLEGYAAVTGRGAAIRIEFGDSADWQWALNLWRELAPVDDGVAAAA